MVVIHTTIAIEEVHVIQADDLTRADESILDTLRNGARTKGAITDETGLHRNTVGNRLDVLEAGDVVERIHEPTALYKLVEDPRGDATQQEQPRADSVDIEAISHVIDDLEAAFERGDRVAIQEAITRMRTAIDDV